MRLKNLVLMILMLIAVCAHAQSAPEKWNFVWVSSGPSQYDVSKGWAVVSIKSGKIEATMSDESKIEYKCQGSIKNNLIKAKLTIMESDYFNNSPFSGSYSVKKWQGDPQSSGRESIILTDGWNVIALTREIAKRH